MGVKLQGSGLAGVWYSFRLQQRECVRNTAETHKALSCVFCMENKGSDYNKHGKISHIEVHLETSVARIDILPAIFVA